MRKRPKLIQLIALIYLFLPLVKILLDFFVFDYFEQFDDLVRLVSLVRDSWGMYGQAKDNHQFLIALVTRIGFLPRFFSYFLIYPLMGFAIYRVTKWSFSVILLGKLFVVIMSFEYLTNLPFVHDFQTMITADYFLKLYFVDDLQGIFTILFILLNLLVLLYLFRPHIKELYFDPSKRWWAQMTRFSTNIPCVIESVIKGTILNLSIGGAYINLEDIALPEVFRLAFEELGFNINTKVELVHRHIHDDGTIMIGVKFFEVTEPTKNKLLALMNDLKKFNELYHKK